MVGAIGWVFLSFATWLQPHFLDPVIVACKEGPGPVAIERKLLGAWKGGACQGNWVFRDNGTFELDHYSPANLHLSGTWTMRWDALPPTLVTTFSSSADSKYALKKWELRLTQLDEKTMEYQFPEGGSSHFERSKK